MPQQDGNGRGNLSLTRQVGEQIVIGDPADPLVVLTVAEASGSKARILFHADPRLRIDRREIVDHQMKGQPHGGRDHRSARQAR